jgi:mutator protein MutT
LAAIQVVAALIYQGGRLLVCQRREEGPFPLKWEFPGGKVEGGEEGWAALRRELLEELGIEILSAKEIYRHQHRYPDPLEVELIFFRVEVYRGTVVNRAFQQILWAELRELEQLDFLEADLPLIERLLSQERP